MNYRRKSERSKWIDPTYWTHPTPMNMLIILAMIGWVAFWFLFVLTILIWWGRYLIAFFGI